MKKSCGIFSNIAPLYSRPLWEKLSRSNEVDYFFYTSRKGFSGIKTINPKESIFLDKDAKFKWFFLRNIYIRDILFYQIGAIYKCLFTDYDSYIFNAEAQCLSTWIGALVCRLKKKPVLFWGHGLYGKESALKKAIRLLFYRLANYHLIYGNRSRLLMIDEGFDAGTLFTVYNSLDYELHQELYSSQERAALNKMTDELFPETSKWPVVIFIGRLTRNKKISYLLEAIYLCKGNGRDINCLIVGSGTESDALKKQAYSLGLGKTVCFYGPCYDERLNASMIMLAECCVSPGNVGLAAIHSMSLGTPVITHRNLSNQGPEVEAIIENKTGLFYEEDNVQSLAEAIVDLLFIHKKSSMEEDCLEQIKKYWNPGNQALQFDKAVLQACSRK